MTHHPTTPAQKTALTLLGFSQAEIEAMTKEEADERITLLGGLLENDNRHQTNGDEQQATGNTQPQSQSENEPLNTETVLHIPPTILPELHPGGLPSNEEAAHSQPYNSGTPAHPAEDTQAQIHNAEETTSPTTTPFPRTTPRTSHNKPAYEVLARVVFSIMLGFFSALVLMEQGYRFWPTLGTVTTLTLCCFFLYWQNTRPKPTLNTKRGFFHRPNLENRQDAQNGSPQPRTAQGNPPTLGRMGRKEYGQILLGASVFLLITAVVIGVLVDTGLIESQSGFSAFLRAVVGLLATLLLCALILASAQRTKDMGISGWWLAFPFLAGIVFPPLYLFLILALLTIPGRKGVNAYGPPSTSQGTTPRPSRPSTNQDPRVYTLTYTSADGSTSTRRIKPLLSSDQYTQAFCLEKDDYRTFRKDRIASVLDSAGTSLSPQAFWTRITNDPNVGDLDKACSTFIDDVLEPSLFVLTYLAKADGDITEEQEDAIDQAIDELVEQSNLYIDGRRLAEAKRRNHSTRHTQPAFTSALDQIGAMDHKYQNALCEGAYAVAENGTDNAKARKRFKAIVEACNNDDYLTPWV